VLRGIGRGGNRPGTPACLGALTAALLLAGCNGVVSARPWFGDADSIGAPRLREGVWRVVPQPGRRPCPVDEGRPLETWPDCAIGLVAGAHDLVHPGAKSRERWPYVIAAGAPPLLQIADAESRGKRLYYLWVRPVRLDAQGRSVTIKGWRVQCEPPPATAPPGAEALYAGLAATGDDCTAGSAAALRAAARSTEADDTSDVFEAHWVRDGSR